MTDTDIPATIGPEVEARVTAGAAWLDGDKPDWLDKFRGTFQLEMRVPSQCVLGHVYGSYWDAPIPPAGGDWLLGDVDRWGACERWAADHGFQACLVVYDWPHRSTAADYRRLKQAWLAEINRRLALVPAGE